MSRRDNPIVRIQKITLENFKNVKHGEITLECGRNFIPRDTRSDILALYGQNGSGKSVLVEALAVLKSVISGDDINDIDLHSKHYIAAGESHARLGFLFELQYSPDSVLQVLYEFTIKYAHDNNADGSDIELNEDNDFVRYYKFFVPDVIDNTITYTICDEKLQIAKYRYVPDTKNASGRKKETIYRMHTVIDTSLADEKYPFAPAAKRKILLDNDDESIIKAHKKYQLKAEKESSSYIFSFETIKSFLNLKTEKSKEYVTAIAHLWLYGKQYLYVLPNKTITISMLTPVILGPEDLIPTSVMEDFGDIFFAITTMNNDHTRQYFKKDGDHKFDPYSVGVVMFGGCSKDEITDDEISRLKDFFDNCINVLLNKLIPGLSASFELYSDDTFEQRAHDKDLESDKEVIRILIQRNGTKLPLTEESDGIKRLFFFAYLFICAFNNPEYTIVIDELDSNIFEHLLCDLLMAFMDEGSGQLIFTSHNLRLLEILDKKSLYFTTTNPYNRYIQLKGIGNTNNVRSVYQRSLMGLVNQDEELYAYSSRDDLIEALTMTGLYFEEREDKEKIG